MDQIPAMNLDPMATPWGRWAQQSIVDAQNTIIRLNQNAGNASSASNATFGVLRDAVATVQSLTTNLQKEITALIGANVTTGIVTASGAITGASVNVTGAATSATLAVSGTSSQTGDATFGGILRVPSIYNNSITSSYRAVYTTSVDGALGYNLSSAIYKQDIANYTLDPKVLNALRIVSFRYIAAVEEYGDDAATEIGFLAEEVDALGLQWLVDYRDGKPDGIKFDRLAVAALGLAQSHETRIAAIEKRLSALEQSSQAAA
jgi:hypothetical protein